MGHISYCKALILPFDGGTQKRTKTTLGYPDNHIHSTVVCELTRFYCGGL
jgi:hypothetical protein